MVRSGIGIVGIVSSGKELKWGANQQNKITYFLLGSRLQRMSKN